MISTKTLTSAAVAFATANGLSAQSKLNAQAQAQAKVEAEFLGSVGDTFGDAWDWTKGAGESAYKWSKRAAYDVGDAFKDMGNWMANEDNWSNLAHAIAAPVYTPPFNVGGDGPSQEEMCRTYEPQPGELIPDNPAEDYYNDYDDTYTSDFNYQLESSGIPTKMIYGLFGDVNAPDWRMMRTTHCEAIDCLNPCYGDGSCFKCADAALESGKETGDGIRIPVCDLCTVPKRGRR